MLERLNRIMSPFAVALRELRLLRRLRQSDAAELLGYEQTYISALEVGTKGPPPEAFVDRVVRVFELQDLDEKRLRDAHEASHRRVVIPVDAPENVYMLVNELRQQIEQLHPAQIELIRIALKFPQAIAVESIRSERLRRRTFGKGRRDTEK